MKLVPIRDSRGNLVASTLEKTTKRENLRAIISRLTGGGETLVLNMVRLANCTPIEVKGPDGTVLAEPLVPTPAVALEANKWLADQLGGKAVPQNEVDRTAAENAVIEQLRSLSDDELEQRVKAIIEPKVIDLLPEEAALPEAYPEDE